MRSFVSQWSLGVRSWRFPAACLLLVVLALRADTVEAQKVPEGFRAELLYSAPEIEHPSVVICDDEGNLFVGEDPMDMRGPTTEEFDRVLYIKFDGAGRPVRKTVFCDRLSAVFGLCWLDGALYVLHAPHYTRFRDTDGDGVADERTDLADGFGPPAGVLGFNDHIVTGTRLGLDGYLYISVGDKGIQKATGADGSSITLEGGGVVRMFPDGTRLEVVTSGTRNHLDVAMDSLDNIFTYDNTDDGLGWWTRFTHHIPTGYYGYPYDYHPHPDRHLPRISEHGGGSPTGADVYREAAWPEKYRESPFHCEWGKRKIQRFILKPRGASFDAEIEDFMTPEEGSEFRPQDLCFSPDGKFMYVADWNFGGWTKPDVVGRLYRVSYVGGDVPAEPPRATGADSLRRQLEALGHPAYSERLRAQRYFVGLGESSSQMYRMLRGPGNARAKIHAIWTLYHLSLPPSETAETGMLTEALADSDPDVRGQAARAIGELYAIRRDWLNSEAKGVWDAALLQTLADTAPGVRLRSAVALGQTQRTAPREMYAALTEEDPYVRFALVQALRGIGDWRLAGEFLDSPDERVRTAVLLALTGQYTDGAVAALAQAAGSARESQVRAAAVALLAEVHLQADPYTTGWWGTQPARSAPARAKKNTWSGTPTVAAAVRAALEQADPAVRAAAVRAVATVNDADAVTIVRCLLSSDANEEVVAAAIATLAALKDGSAVAALVEIAGGSQRDEALRAAAVDALGALGAEAAVAPLVALVANDATPESVMGKCFAALAVLKGDTAREALVNRLSTGPAPLRVQAIEVYAQLAGRDGGGALAAQLDDPDPAVREAAIRAVGSVEHRASVPKLVALTGDAAYRFAAIRALARMPDPRALGSYLDGVADKSPELRDDCCRALAAIRGEIGDALVALEQRQELSATAKRELKAILAEPMLVRDWHLAGAWKKEHRPEFDPAQAPALDQKVLAAGHPRTWRQLTLAPEQDRWNLLEHMKPVDGAWCVGYAMIAAERDESTELQLGSDDQLTVWLNGQQVYEHRDSRGWGPDQARAPVTLKAGANHLWVLAGNDSGPWEFSVRVRREDPRFAFLNVDVADRPGPEAYREFALQKPGDPQRGRKLFEDRQGVGCIKCHAVGGQGATIGPDLLSVGTKYPREELIRSVLEPSNRILSGYQVTIIITDDGRTHQGIVKRETPEAIELVDAEGKTTSLAVDTVVDREDSNVSMMPNGLKDGLTLEDFADVVAYLESLKQETGAK